MEAFLELGPGLTPIPKAANLPPSAALFATLAALAAGTAYTVYTFRQEKEGDNVQEGVPDRYARYTADDRADLAYESDNYKREYPTAVATSQFSSQPSLFHSGCAMDSEFVQRERAEKAELRALARKQFFVPRRRFR